jgi:hypothetical protein
MTDMTHVILHIQCTFGSNIYSTVITLPVYFLVFSSKDFLTRLQMIQHNIFCQGDVYFINVIKFYSTQIIFVLFMPRKMCVLSCADFMKLPNVQQHYI